MINGDHTLVSMVDYDHPVFARKFNSGVHTKKAGASLVCGL